MVRKRNRIHGNNELERFLISFFIIETAGQAAVFVPARILRMLGVTYIYETIEAIPHFRHLLFTLLLLVAVGVNIYIIMCKRRRR